MASVHIDQLDIVLGGTPILKNLSLDIADGEFLVLLGPSGCGKSTLLHTIAGFIEVAGGSVRIGDRDVTWADPKDREIGMVFQSYALYPTMNVERNMSFGLRVAGVPRDEVDRRVQRAAEMLHLTELLKRRPAQLSGGQRQRVAIGRALVRDAKVFLLDEPLSNLDAKLRGELRRELKQLHHTLGTTMIYVTHDQVEAMTLASRIVVMKKGEIQQVGAPGEVYQRPATLFVAGFLGAPGMNFIDGKLTRAGGGWRFDGAGLTLDVSGYPFARPPADGQAVVLGLRPENLMLHPPQHAEPPSDGHARLGTVRAAMTEPLGAVTLVWADSGDQRIGVQMGPDTDPPLHSEQALWTEVSRVSLFDRGTEQRL